MALPHYGNWIPGSFGPTGSFGATGSNGITGAQGAQGISSVTIYHVLGEDVFVNGSKDVSTALFVSMLNLLGKPFYDEVKNQGINFPEEIEEFIKKRIISWERDKKISSII